ncbi:reverse transcriptase/ribonuclease H [Ixodes scapularis]
MCLDCSRGFLQIQVAPHDIQKTAFTCHRGLFEFIRLPFGLSNSPSSFQRLMDILLGDAKFNFAMAHMDDVVVFSKSFEEHLAHLEIILSRMSKAGLTINPKKVQPAASRVNLLGFIVDDGTLRPNKDKLRAVLDYPPPRNAKSLQRFLGMVGFYRQFIPGCAGLTRILNLLLHKGSRWAWGREQDIAFSSLTKAIAATASLCLPDLNRPFAVQADMSNYGVGAMLLQEHD